jgi:WD40 repeat protein
MNNFSHRFDLKMPKLAEHASAYILSFALSSDGHYLAAVGKSPHLYLWDFRLQTFLLAMALPKGAQYGKQVTHHNTITVTLLQYNHELVTPSLLLCNIREGVFINTNKKKKKRITP